MTTKKNTRKKIEGETAWMMRKFPITLKNRFLGACKQDGHRPQEIVEFLLLDFLRKRDHENKTNETSD